MNPMKWISVKDKLPDYGKQVLVYRSSCDLCITNPDSIFHMHSPQTILGFAVATYNHKQPEVARYFCNRNDFTYSHLYEDHWDVEYVRYWMPFPKEPNEVD